MQIKECKDELVTIQCTKKEFIELKNSIFMSDPSKANNHKTLKLIQESIHLSCENKAKSIAYRAHDGQTRKNGQAYITHPQNVVNHLINIDKYDRNTKADVEVRIVGWLHDVIEDTKITLNDLRDKGFNDTIVTAIDAISRRENETYLNFILRIKNNQIAKRVKLADLKDNLCTLKRGSLKDKYLMAIHILTH